MPIERPPEGPQEGLPEITQEEVRAYFSLPFEERDRIMIEAMEHFRRHYPWLFSAIYVNSEHLIPPLRDPNFFRTMAVSIYMFFLKKLGNKFPSIRQQDYEKLARRLMGQNSDTLLQEMTGMLFNENYHLNDVLIDSINQKGLAGDLRHMNGAMLMYYLIRKSYLKQKRRRRWN